MQCDRAVDRVGCTDTSTTTGNTMAQPNAPQTENISASWRYDIGDKCAIAGNAQVIFVGRVLAQVGTTPWNAGRRTVPRTQFSVQVITSLKGDRAGQVTVNQMGGRKPDGTLTLFEHDRLLEVGSTYLLAANYSEDDHWYTLIPRAGTQKVGTDLNAARVAIGADPLVTEWRAAISNPTPPVPRRIRNPLPPAGAEGAPRLVTPNPDSSIPPISPDSPSATPSAPPTSPSAIPEASPPPPSSPQN